MRTQSNSRKMIDMLKRRAEIAGEIAAGNLEVEIEAASEEDALGHAMIGMKERIMALAADTKKLVFAAKAGDLQLRVDAKHHSGEFAKIVEGINQSLDAVVDPLAVMAGYLERIAKGDIPERIEEEMKGDFARMKQNLETSAGAVRALLNDTETLVRAAVEGRLDTRLDAGGRRMERRVSASSRQFR